MSNFTPTQLKRIARLKQVADQGNIAVTKYLFDIEDQIPALTELVERMKGDPGKDGATPVKGIDYNDGQDGYTPIKGIDYEDGHDYVLTEIDKKEIASKIKVPIVEKIIERTEVIREQPIIKETINKTTIENPVTVNQIVEKLNTVYDEVDPHMIKGWADLERMIRINANIPKDFDVRIGVSKTEIKGVMDRVAALESGSTISGVSSIIAGTNITIDPVGGTGAVTINSTGGSGGSGYEPATGAVDGSNAVFGPFTVAPTVIVSDFRVLRKTEDGGTTVNWTGTTTITVTEPPTNHIYKLT